MRDVTKSPRRVVAPLEELDPAPTPPTPPDDDGVARRMRALISAVQHRTATALGVDESGRTETVVSMLSNNRRRAPGYWIQLSLAMGIATVGLVLNSTAVVIGAMLVSPLMGPIVELGMGFAVGSPLLTLRASLRVFLSTAIVVGGATVLTLALPFHELTPEIAARTAPTALDLLVAAFCALTAAYTTVRPASDTTSAAAVPSRGRVGAYRRLRTEVESLVGRINGEFATPSWTPIQYLYRSMPMTTVIALYRAADVMLVTPVRDGMNLVAKEFVACRADEDGVLILSEFAGAADELTDACIVNPYDVDGVADAIHDALSLSGSERRTRMRRLRDKVFGHDVHAWANDFLSALEAARPSHASTGGG